MQQMNNQILRAAGFILCGMAILAFVDQFVRVIAESSSLWMVQITRTLMIWSIVMVLILWKRKALKVRQWRGVIARSTIMSVAMMIYFGALAYLPVTQVAAGLFTAPLWVLLFSVAFFGQTIGPVRIAAVVLGFLGVLLVLSPDPQALEMAIFVPVLAGAFYAVAMIATREWCEGEGALELALGIFTMMGIMGLLGGASVALFGLEAPNGSEGFVLRGFVWPTVEAWAWTGAQAVGSLAGVFLITKGYQCAAASYASVFEYALLVFSALFGWLIWKDDLGLTTIAGIVCVIAAAALIAFRTEQQT